MESYSGIYYFANSNTCIAGKIFHQRQINKKKSTYPTGRCKNHIILD